MINLLWLIPIIIVLFFISLGLTMYHDCNNVIISKYKIKYSRWSHRYIVSHYVYKPVFFSWFWFGMFHHTYKFITEKRAKDYVHQQMLESMRQIEEYENKQKVRFKPYTIDVGTKK